MADDKGRKLFRQAIDILATKPLGRERVEWNAVRDELEKTIPAEAGTTSAHAAIQAAVARLGDPHARFMPPPGSKPVRETNADTSTSAPSSAAGTPRGEIPTEPSGRMLDGRIAFVTVPMCPDADAATLRAYAFKLRKAILKLEQQKPAGWVIDLRFNGGGSVWPMLLGLRPILCDGTLTTSLVNGSVVSRVGCDNATVWLDRSLHGSGTKEEQLRISSAANEKPVSPTRVAVLIGPWTMSSGELTALALRGLAQVRFFGENTAGLTTVTDYFPLADGSILNLPVSHMADRNGVAPLGPVKPDEVIENEAWPSPDDQVSTAARAWAQGKGP